MIGQTISHYKVQEKLGEGGMGAVYRAHDTKLNRDVATTFLTGLLQQDNTALKRYLREAQSSAALDHSFICNIHDVEQSEEDQDFIVMEYVKGQTLKEKNRRGTWRFNLSHLLHPVPGSYAYS